MTGGGTYARIVRVSVVRGGGFSGLVRTTSVATDQLSPGDRQKLAALVQQSGLDDAPAAPSSGEPEPDRFTYAVTLEDQGRTHTAGFSERSMPEGVRNLISWVSTVDGHEESIGPPGGGHR